METFSKKVKEELSLLHNLSDKNLVKCELKGYLLTTDSNKFVTESEYNINRFSKLLSNSGIDDFKIEMQGNKFCITTKNKIEIEYRTENEEEIRAVVRGSFMGAGSVTDPKSKYHLEIVFQNEENAEKIKELIMGVKINCKIIKRDKNYVVYMKDGEDIANFLAFIGASKAVLNFEDIRVLRDVRNKVVKTSVKQIEDIKLIKKKNKFNKLSEKEKELANLRLNNPDSTLAELGTMLNKPIGKSGVNHRMKVISDLAEEIKKEEKSNI